MNLKDDALMVLLLMLIVKSAFSQSTAPIEARLLNQSTSGQTIIFNLGEHDNVRAGDFAIVLKKVRGNNVRDLRVVPAARARVVKVNTDSSVWILYKLIDPKLMKKGDKYLVMTETQALRGRLIPSVQETTIISSKNESKEVTKSAIVHDRNRIAKLADKYGGAANLHGPEERSDKTFDLLTVEEWEKNKGDAYRTALYRSPDREEFRRQFRLETFEKLVTGYLKKVNDPDFSYDAFYEEQMRDNFSNEFRKSSAMQTEYKNFLADQQLSRSADAKLYRSILEKGESWSEDFSDEELRDRLQGVSVLQENDRRLFISSKPNRYMLNFDYGKHFTDSQESEDAVTKRTQRFTVGANFELVPFLRHPKLERFTLDIGGRVNKNAFEYGGTNAHYNEVSGSLGANWYPLYAPYTVQAPVLFLGTYIRTGTANAMGVRSNEKANYTVYSFPGFRGGLKYMIKSNFGLRIAVSMETLNMDQYESSEVNGALPASTKLVEGKADVGLILAF
jgi:hypothetical protein